jgi:hypothetical protein
VATVISKCKAAGFTGRMEWIGIPYTSTTGHSIVIARRQGQLSNVASWGDYFVIDLWYYNLGMRKEYVISSTAARNEYYASDIRDYVGKLKVMADIP